MKNNKRKNIILNMCLVALFTSLLVVSAFMRIPMPLGDYLTLQLEVIILIGFVLKPHLALASSSLYVFMGLIGLPVFAAGGGIDYVLRPSFGYFIGFILASFIISIIFNKVRNHKIVYSVLIAILGILIIYLCGYFYKYLLYIFYLKEDISLWAIILATMSFELPKDLLLGIICGVIGEKLNKISNKIV